MVCTKERQLSAKSVINENKKPTNWYKLNGSVHALLANVSARAAYRNALNREKPLRQTGHMGAGGDEASAETCNETCVETCNDGSCNSVCLVSGLFHARSPPASWEMCRAKTQFELYTWPPRGPGEFYYIQCTPFPSRPRCCLCSLVEI